MKEGTLTVEGTAGNDRITAALADGKPVVNTNGVEQRYLPWQVKRLIIRGGAGSDSILLSPGTPDAVLEGGPGNDSLVGGAGRDAIRGGDGKDDLRGGDGNDVLDGGAGADRSEVDTADLRQGIESLRVYLATA